MMAMSVAWGRPEDVVLDVSGAAVAVAEVEDEEDVVEEEGVALEVSLEDTAVVAAEVVGRAEEGAAVVGTTMEGAAVAAPLNESSTPTSPPSAVVAGAAFGLVTTTGAAVVAGVTTAAGVVAAGATGAAVTAAGVVAFETWRRIILPSSSSCLWRGPSSRMCARTTGDSASARRKTDAGWCIIG
jgi:hypothetical protein